MRRELKLMTLSYIVRSLHKILKTHFGRSAGFADESVTVLDPAGGTLTFLAETAKLAVREFVERYGDGQKGAFIKEHILKHFYAFELMMAPYAVGHLKMALLLEELGYRLREDDRFQLYLTNTLEMEALAQIDLPGMKSISEESRLAGEVKKKQPILVILGNPPYSGHSANVGTWITHSLKDGETLIDGMKDDGYYTVDGKPLGEKNPKWLQDDYVKFIRFAQCKIDQAGEGVLGFITNHSYLDNPTFRGMRRSLMNSFDEIYILDLHGNSLKKEICPDGSKDENVFDIRQGVAIAFFIKKRDNAGVPNFNLAKNNSGGPNLDLAKDACKVYYSELWGLREEKKYPELRKHDIGTTHWQPLSPTSEFYLFVPRDEGLLESYEKYPKITEIFPLNGVGMTTARDSFVIDKDKNLLENRIRLFKNSQYSDDDLHTFFRINKKKGWSIRKAWNMLQSIPDSDLHKFILPVLYRPFDVQWIFYHDSVVWRTVKRIMYHMIQENLGVVLPKRVETKIPWQHVVCTSNIVEHVTVSLKTIDYLFPLYLYPDTEKRDLFSQTKEPGHKEPNISPGLLSTFSQSYQYTPTPEEIFYYIYAVLYSNIYRAKYAEFLKIDFPRIPFTKDYDLFCQLGEYGRRLVDLHLLKSADLDPPITRFQGEGESAVDNLKYDRNTQRVSINPHQYFEGVPQEVWEYQIGGYQVCQKWLKDRKGRRLSLDEVKHYGKIVTALHKTIALQAEIDTIYPSIEDTKES
jgi:predicted helicase